MLLPGVSVLARQVSEARAVAEHLLRVVDPVDDTYRRQMNRQLTVQESRHKLARDVCHGKRGTIHQAYRDGMEDQLGALGLVLNAIVLWTTKYIGAAGAQLKAGATRFARRTSPGSPRSSTARGGWLAGGYQSCVALLDGRGRTTQDVRLRRLGLPHAGAAGSSRRTP
ncbi:Tn3 family transposase [Amycolatopsis sp. DSM 110486]|uniref:Tn3 family transposase n=1 Tax=Amycolatopsis sp. DSM 110486 TaxID=2865832 RepID=UPI00351D755A